MTYEPETPRRVLLVRRDGKTIEGTIPMRDVWLHVEWREPEDPGDYGPIYTPSLVAKHVTFDLRGVRSDGVVVYDEHRSPRLAARNNPDTPNVCPRPFPPRKERDPLDEP